MRKNKIEIISATNNIGGAEILTNILIEGLAKSNFLVDLHVLKSGKNSILSNNFSRVKYYSEYFKVGILYGIFFAAFDFFRKKNKPKFIIGSTEGWPHFIALLRGFFLRTKVILWVQADIVGLSDSYWNWFEKFLFSWCLRVAYKVVCVSDKSKSSAASFCKDKIIGDKFSIIDGCVRDHFFNNVEKIYERDIDIIFVGRLEPIKNVNLLVDVVYKNRSSFGGCVYIIGDGTEKSGLIERTDKLFGKNNPFLFTGMVSDVDRYMRRAKTLVLCSRSEGFGLVVIEALASDVRVILTPFDGASFFKNNFNGIFVAKSYSELDIFEAILLALQNSRVQVHNMSLLQWTENAFVDRWLNFLSKNNE